MSNDDKPASSGGGIRFLTLRSGYAPAHEEGNMHCFIVSNNHLNAILSAVHQLSDAERQGMVKNLVALNIMAYNECHCVDYDFTKVELSYGKDYTYKAPDRRYDALEALKLLDCLEFQLKSLRGYEEYPDYKRIASMKDWLTKNIPGYNILKWSIT